MQMRAKDEQSQIQSIHDRTFRRCTSNPLHRRSHLILPSLSLASPIIGIGVKNEIGIICEGNVEEESEYEHYRNGGVLHPSGGSGSFVVTCETDEDEEDDEEYLDLLTGVHGW
eukprot:CAMPEP_0197246548 /NCGR_PEP_ID=MMETSP1429-20130617/15583_1 /TAXON_ID=49237 /ORGANISM="Chaetoceros  sp., Strain UNC1202" /LENGTH=112 /DNA_ID=CAMNT_0042707233 /DNA_START=263 /DNA_END=598 /DNA_ORIENTATION=-